MTVSVSPDGEASEVSQHLLPGVPLQHQGGIATVLDSFPTTYLAVRSVGVY